MKIDIGSEGKIPTCKQVDHLDGGAFGPAGRGEVLA